MTIQDKDITESWKEKIYEEKYTDFFFKVGAILANANNTPTLPNVQQAFSGVKSVAYILIYNRVFMESFNEHIKPVLSDIEKILYGNEENEECQKAQAKFKVKIQTEPKTGERKIINIQHILHELWEIYFLVKQWAYQMGFFARKPFVRKYGKEAMQDVLDM